MTARSFSGIPCRNGHVAERYSKRGQCVVCNAATRLRYKNNKNFQCNEVNAATSRSDAIRLGKSRYKTGIACKNGHIAERATINGMCFECKDKYRNRKRDSLTSKQYRNKNREKVRSWKNNRRARKNSAVGSFTASEIRQLYKLQRGRCAYCRVVLSNKNRHIDHIIPLSLGGSNFIRNIQLTCAVCNCKKQSKHPIEYAQKIGLLV